MASDRMEQAKAMARDVGEQARAAAADAGATAQDLARRAREQATAASDALYQQSMRADKPYVKVDVGALTESLFESELFGHKKGAFTDAREDRVGRIEAANGGTLFLDEIGNITLQQQAKLLSVLQNRQGLWRNTRLPSRWSGRAQVSCRCSLGCRIPPYTVHRRSPRAR